MPDTVTTRYSDLAPRDMLDEIFWKDAREPQDERLWVPSGPGRWNRPLCLNVSQGYWVHLTKVTQAGVVSRHRHPAPVHGFVLEGRWRYLERDWVATAGSYLFEPPGDVHTLVVDEGDYMITLFHNTGALLYCDEQGRTVGSTDVFTRLKRVPNSDPFTRSTAMSNSSLTIFTACAAVAMICGCADTVRGPASPDERTTYSSEHGWAKLDRTWGSTSAVDVDARGNVWVFERCGAN